MIKYFCDFCGKEITKDFGANLFNKKLEIDFNPLCEPQKYEICNKCANELLAFVNNKIKEGTAKEREAAREIFERQNAEMQEALQKEEDNGESELLRKLEEMMPNLSSACETAKYSLSALSEAAADSEKDFAKNNFRDFARKKGGKKRQKNERV